MMESSKQSKQKSFKALWQFSLVAQAEMLRRLTRSASHLGKARLHAYDWTKTYLEMQQEYHNELLAEVKAQGKKLEDWIEAMWEPVERYLEPRGVVMKAIDAGISRKEFASQHAGVWLVNRLGKGPRYKGAKSAKQRAENTMPPEPTADMTKDAIIDRLRAIIASQRAQMDQLKAELRDFKKGWRESQHNIAQASQSNKRLMRAIQAGD